MFKVEKEMCSDTSSCPRCASKSLSTSRDFRDSFVAPVNALARKLNGDAEKEQKGSTQENVHNINLF
jgi:hypothetical protein